MFTFFFNTQKGGEGKMAELRLKTKYKEDAIDLSSDTKINKRVRKSLAKSRVPAYQNNRRQIHIVLSEFSMRFSVECDPGTSVTDILEYLGEIKAELKQDLDKFEIIAYIRKPEGAAAGIHGSLTEPYILKSSDSLFVCKYERIVSSSFFLFVSNE